jgi:hypothetical protein
MCSLRHSTTPHFTRSKIRRACPSPSFVARGDRPAFTTDSYVENVGNLVCPALFDLGEGAKVVMLSVTEGDDKPLKYPHMFRAADIVIITKSDLLPHVDFSIDRSATCRRSTGRSGASSFPPSPARGSVHGTIG